MRKTMAKLSYQQRKRLPKNQFVIPSKAPGGGSFPIPDLTHARNALARSSGKPVEGRVRAAVKRKFPSIGRGSALSSYAPTKKGNK
jgi:hypothetical protein